MSTSKTTSITNRAGRPPLDMTPKTKLAKRLQHALSGKKISDARSYFGVKNSSTAAKYLRGDREPTVECLGRFIANSGCDGHWLLTGEKKTPASSAGEMGGEPGTSTCQRGKICELLPMLLAPLQEFLASVSVDAAQRAEAIEELAAVKAFLEERRATRKRRSATA